MLLAVSSKGVPRMCGTSDTTKSHCTGTPAIERWANHAGAARGQRVISSSCKGAEGRRRRPSRTLARPCCCSSKSWPVLLLLMLLLLLWRLCACVGGRRVLQE
jgi:hypothetical protein